MDNIVIDNDANEEGFIGYDLQETLRRNATLWHRMRELKREVCRLQGCNCPGYDDSVRMDIYFAIRHLSQPNQRPVLKPCGPPQDSLSDGDKDDTGPFLGWDLSERGLFPGFDGDEDDTGPFLGWDLSERGLFPGFGPTKENENKKMEEDRRRENI